ncbi:MAG: transcriptional regulator [Prevotella sp.]|nr:transcriptional regulator [Prevotella sp.]
MILTTQLFLALSVLIGHAQTPESVDSLLHCIDEAIDHSAQYVSRKEQRIRQLQQQLSQAKNLHAEYQLSYRLYEEYTPFVNDSAIIYLKRCIEIARKTGKHSEVGKCQALIAIRCSSTGKFIEALNTLNAIDTTQLDNIAKGTYYMAYNHVYGEIIYYRNPITPEAQYGAMAAEYRQRMYAALPPTSNSVFQYRELDALNAHDNREAMRINDQWLSHVEKGSHPYALVTLYRYLAYKAENDSTRMMYWLAESVLTDIKNGVMDQGSMWEMANQLMGLNDADRAYKYISFNSICANRFGSRQRLAQISPLLSVIAKMYKDENDQYNRRQNNTLCIISILALMLLISVFYVSRQRHKLAIARDDLAKTNHQQHELNAQLKSLNEQLSCTNSQLSVVNHELTDANRVKEEYVGRFMRLCSIYINKIEDLRKRVHKKLKTRQYDELYEMTRQQNFKEEELEEFYTNFDSAFLQLFPHFLDSFNALLRPEERIEQPKKEQLSTPIRIFALIRLGITDSSKIAEFLHYSVNTIYNYRAHIKKGAINDKDSFEEDVRKIGTF